MTVHRYRCTYTYDECITGRIESSQKKNEKIFRFLKKKNDQNSTRLRVCPAGA